MRGSRELGMASFTESRVGNQFCRSGVTTVPSKSDEVAPVLDSAHCITGSTVRGTRGIDGHEGAVSIGFHGPGSTEDVRRSTYRRDHQPDRGAHEDPVRPAVHLLIARAASRLQMLPNRRRGLSAVPEAPNQPERTSERSWTSASANPISARISSVCSPIEGGTRRNGGRSPSKRTDIFRSL